MERLSQEVVRLRDGYAHALNHVPYPAVLADKEGKIEAWNTAAQKLFHLALDAWVGIDLSEFPVQPSLGRALRRKHRAVVEGTTTLDAEQPIGAGEARHPSHGRAFHFS